MSTSVEDRGAVVLETIQASEGIYVLTQMIEWEISPLMENDSSLPESSGLVTQIQAQRARTLCEQKISILATQGTLWEHRQAHHLITFWANGDKRPSVVEWLREQLNAEKSTLQLLHHFALRRFGRKQFDLRESADFAQRLDLPLLREKAEALVNKELLEDENELVQAFLYASSKLEENES